MIFAESKMAAPAVKYRASVLAVKRCSRCGGSWLSNIKYRLFSDCKTEDKTTHFGYERVSEEEKTEKGKNINL